MKIITTLLLVCSYSFLLAQDNLVDQLKADVLRSKSMTLAYVNSFPEERLNDRPGEGSRTFAEQVLHMSQGMINLSSNGFGTERLYTKVNLESDSTYFNRSSLLAIVEESHAYVLNGLDELDETTLYETVTKGPFEITRLSWILKSQEHTSHHRGQCAVYFRVFGLITPNHQLF